MTTATHDPQTEADAWCTPKPKRATGGGLRSVGTALDVLECFAVDSALGVSDVARRLGAEKGPDATVIVNLSGRGDKDIDHVRRTLDENPDYVLKED